MTQCPCNTTGPSPVLDLYVSSLAVYVPGVGRTLDRSDRDQCSVLVDRTPANLPAGGSELLQLSGVVYRRVQGQTAESRSDSGLPSLLDISDRPVLNEFEYLLLGPLAQCGIAVCVHCVQRRGSIVSVLAGPGTEEEVPGDED